MSSSSPSSRSGAFPRRRRSSPRWRANTVAALLALVAAGCGGGNEEHDAFVGEVEAVCERHSREREALPAPQSTQQLVTYVDELARLARTQLTDLRALEPPADDRAVYRRMLDQQQATLGVYADLRNAVRGGIPSAIESVLRRANESNRKVAEAAVELGAGACVPGEAGETATGR